MVISKNYPSFSPEEYLEIEEISTIKNEYIQGQIYAIAGASKAHVIITGNLVTLLNTHLRGSSCLVFSTDMKVRVESANTFYYPDLTITCHESDRFSSESFIRHPRVIIEVLSDKTEAFDRGDKFADYKTLESLEEYILVSQSQPIVEKFSRNEQGFWIPSVYQNEQEFRIDSIGFQASCELIYENVELLS